MTDFRPSAVVRRLLADALCLVAAGVIFGGIAALIVGAW